MHPWTQAECTEATLVHAVGIFLPVDLRGVLETAPPLCFKVELCGSSFCRARWLNRVYLSFLSPSDWVSRDLRSLSNPDNTPHYPVSSITLCICVCVLVCIGARVCRGQRCHTFSNITPCLLSFRLVSPGNSNPLLWLDWSASKPPGIPLSQLSTNLEFEVWARPLPNLYGCRSLWSGPHGYAASILKQGHLSSFQSFFFFLFTS